MFPLIMQNKVWLGNSSGDMAFKVPEHYEPRTTRYWQEENGQKWRSMGNACWFTNLDLKKRHEDLILYTNYTTKQYPTYDNYNAVEVSLTKDIPADFDGVMGVPLTFVDRHNPDQFDIVGVTQSWFDARTKKYPPQIQVGADGARSSVAKLNDGAALRLKSPPSGKTYYVVKGHYYVKVYARILIRRKPV